MSDVGDDLQSLNSSNFLNMYRTAQLNFPSKAGWHYMNSIFLYKDIWITGRKQVKFYKLKNYYTEGLRA